MIIVIADYDTKTSMTSDRKASTKTSVPATSLFAFSPCNSNDDNLFDSYEGILTKMILSSINRSISPFAVAGETPMEKLRRLNEKNRNEIQTN